MIKLQLKIYATTDLLQTLSDFNMQLENLDISVDEREKFIKEVEKSANDLVRRGNELISVGSQLLVERVIKSESCEVVLDVKFKLLKPTFLSKLRALFLKLRG